jgi:hypothetical protein
MLLSAKQCCADTDCVKQATGTENSQSAKTDTCPDCPPFSVCGASSSSIFLSPAGIALPEAAETFYKHNTIYQQPALPKIAKAIWQPPQLG